MKAILVSLLLLGLGLPASVRPELNCECGKRNAGRIFNGTATKKNEYPWMAAVEYADNEHFCGGSVITERHILTAAHCVWDLTTEDVQVVVGGYDLSNPNEPNSQRLQLEQIIVHENYDNETAFHDIAILLTSKKILYNQFVGPVCLPIEPLKNILTGEPVKVMGWGLTERNYTDESIKQLREIDVEVVEDYNCEEEGAFQICTFINGQDGCEGDSGGPLVWLHPTTNRFTQVALVSYGYDQCGKVTEPSVNTDVSAYLLWIDQKIWPLRYEVHTCHEI